MNILLDHRARHNLDRPRECEGFAIDDYVEYVINGEKQRGYIYCFR